MPLDPAKIKALKAIKNKPRKGGGGRSKAKIDLTTIESRTYDTWFKLDSRMLGADESMARCQSPNCQDPRNPEKGGIGVVEINGQLCCRYCFLDGWLVTDDSNN